MGGGSEGEAELTTMHDTQKQGREDEFHGKHTPQCYTCVVDILVPPGGASLFVRVSLSISVFWLVVT